MYKSYLIVLLMILAAVSSIITLSEVQAAVLNVGSGQPYATISAAIIAAASNDVIMVYPGTYVENINIPAGKNNLLLLCVNQHLAIIKGSITVQSTGIIIDGFRIQTTGSQDGIYLQVGNATVKNNIIEGPIPTPGSGQQSGIKTAGGGNYIIRNNTIMNYRYGMNLDGAASDPASVIDENRVSKAVVVGIILQVGPTGFGNNAILTNNVIENSGAGLVFGNANYQLTNNVIRNNTGTGIYIYGLQYTYGIRIECNLIENNGYGIYLDHNDVNAINNSAHNNNLVNNTNYDVYSNHAALFNATSNWWGSASGPANIFGNVLYTPWLIGCSTCAATPSAGCPSPPKPILTVKSPLITGTTLTAPPGSEFNVEIGINGIPPGWGTTGFDFTVSWDPKYMEYKSHNVIHNGWNVDNSNVDPSNVASGILSMKTGNENIPPKGDAVWLTITFKCLGEGSSKLNVTTGTDNLQNTVWLSYDDSPPIESFPDPAQIIVNQQFRPVGGIVMSTSKLELLIPYFVLAVLVTVILTVIIVKRRD